MFKSVKLIAFIFFALFTFSNNVYGQLPFTENFNSYTTFPFGVTGPGLNNVGGYPSTQPWTLNATGATLIATNSRGTVQEIVPGNNHFLVRNSNGPIVFNLDPINISGCLVNFSIDLSETGTLEVDDYINVEYSTDGGANYSSIPNISGGSAAYTLNDDFTSATINQTGLTGTLLNLRITFNCNSSSERLFMDNINVTGTCTALTNSITTGAITTTPFVVNCSTSTSASGLVHLTSVGTFNAGNTYSVQLSDETGSFSAPIEVGSITSSLNVDDIPITISSASISGPNYLLRIISSNPAILGTNSAAFSITQMATCVPSLPSSQGLLINEFSNGFIGNREYYEFVVAGQCGDLVDIRGYILDDNSGTFSTTFPSSSGVAQGHLRLTNNLQWSNIPVGSLIVIYNADDPNSNFAAASIPGPIADDLTDTNNDSLYVIPHNNTTYFEITSDFPSNSAPDSTYSPVAYNVTTWNPLGLRNKGDAIQVRSPNGTYWHGISYGSVTSNITGGPDNMKIFNSGMKRKVGWFSDGDFFSTANWSLGGLANETPGLPNNPANLAWLRAMRDPTSATCPISILPIELSNFNGNNSNLGNKINWSTSSEKNASHFIIERSTDGKTWENIHYENATGNSTNTMNYSFIDADYEKVVNYYRLNQFDIDGSNTIYNRYVKIDNSKLVNPNVIRIINLLGQDIDANESGIQIHIFEDGTSKKVYHN